MTRPAEPFYAHVRNGRFFNIYRSKRATAMGTHGRDDGEPVVAVLVEESPDGDYYGWEDAHIAGPVLIYGDRRAVEMCFPYGTEAEEKRGRGRVVRLAIREASPPGPR